MSTWTDLELAEHHLAMLQDSGVTPEVAAARGYYTATGPADVPACFSKAQKALTPALVIPIRGVDETDAPIAFELRPDAPRIDSRGRGGKPKVRKYEYPAGVPKVLDVPPTIRHLLGDPNVPLWFTEGARKADAAAARGMACVSLAGVWSFRSTNVDGGRVELPDFDRIAFNGRSVYVCFDSDVIGKPDVRRAVVRLAGVLSRRQAKVHVVVLPPQANGAKNGLDDFLAAGGDEAALLRLVDTEFLAEDDRRTEEKLRDWILDSYTLGQDTEGNAFALPRTGPRLVRMLYAGKPSLHLEVAGAFSEAEAGAPVVPKRIINDVLLQVESRCMNEPRSQLNLRSARAGDALVVDMGTADGRVIVAQANGWGVRESDERFPLFRRTDNVHPLPIPQRGGTLDELRELLNVTDETWPLVLGWLIAAPFGWIPRPWLFHTGPQGSGKSDAALIVAKVWDPREKLTPVPRKGDRSDPAALAANSYILTCDNASHLTPEYSDWLCSLITGAADSRRVLHTTSSMQTLSFMRSGVMTGVTIKSLRSDLIERLVHVEFDMIAEDARKLHGKVMDDFDDAHPRILGALLDAVCTALANLERARRETLAIPRMGDYAMILRAYDLGAGTDLFGAYCRNVSGYLREQAEEDPFCQVVMSYVAEHGAVEMSAADLFQSLSVHRMTMDHVSDDTFWPTSARSFGWTMKRAAADLREAGVSARQGRTDAAKTWKLAPAGQETAETAGKTAALYSLPEQHERSGPAVSAVSAVSGDNFSSVNNKHEKEGVDPSTIYVFPIGNLSEAEKTTGTAGTAALPFLAPADGQVPAVSRCTVCRLQLVIIEPGQTTHPMCDEANGEMSDDDVLAMLAGEHGAERVPPRTPKWASELAKARLNAKRKGEQAAKALGLPGYLSAVGVGSVSAKVDWNITSPRQHLTIEQQERVREIAQRFVTRHAEKHKSATHASPAVSRDYVLVVLSRTDLDAFLAELVLVVKGAP